MKDEGWRMKDEGWRMKDEGWLRHYNSFYIMSHLINDIITSSLCYNNAQETYCICWELEGEKLNQKLMIIFILHQINLQWNQWHKQLLLIIMLWMDQMANKNYFYPLTIVKSSLSHYTITHACLTGVEQLLETFAHQTSLNDFLP